MISFYPGPSQVYKEIPNYVKDAHTLGVLSMNHRSKEFVALTQQTVSTLKTRLKVPKEYLVFIASSATECWEIIAQSIIVEKSIHFYNGAFGERWLRATRPLVKTTQAIDFEVSQLLPTDLFFNDGDTICITQNETSNGTQVSNQCISKIKNNNPSHLIAVDATSSMAGIYLNFSSADIWFASVQKCFGLPAGLAIMIVSPRALERARMLNRQNHYNSLIKIAYMMERCQTTHTPNVLDIYLLNRILVVMPPIKLIESRIVKRFLAWRNFFKNSSKLIWLVENEQVQSNTVIVIKSTPTLIKTIKREAKRSGFLLGEGYGSLSDTTFRIANFPAITEKQIRLLKLFLKRYL